MKPYASKRVLLSAGAVLGLGLLILIGVAIQRQTATSNDAKLTLTVSPQDSTVTVDSSTKTKPGEINLAPGSHSITISRDGFTTQNISLEVSPRQQLSKSVALGIANDTGTKYLQANPDEQQQREAIAGADAHIQGQITTSDNPLITFLPYTGFGYDIDFGISELHPKDPHAVAIYVTTDTQAGRNNALNWIRAKGFNPDAYEIIYQTTSEANQ